MTCKGRVSTWKAANYSLLNNFVQRQKSRKCQQHTASLEISTLRFGSNQIRLVKLLGQLGLPTCANVRGHLPCALNQSLHGCAQLEWTRAGVKAAKVTFSATFRFSASVNAENSAACLRYLFFRAFKNVQFWATCITSRRFEGSKHTSLLYLTCSIPRMDTTMNKNQQTMFDTCHAQ